MKRLLICVLAIVMMLSSVAFANESACLNFEVEDLILVDSPERIVVQKTDALHLEVKQNNAGSTIGFVNDAPKCETGKAIKLTNPAKTDEGNLAGFSFVSTFQDVVVGTTKGTRSNVNYGFSFYAPLAVENVNSNAYFYLSLAYRKTNATSNTTFSFLEVKNGEIYPYEERKLEVKPNAKKLADKWYDIRFDIDVADKTIKTYLDSKLFYTTYINDNELDFIRYSNLVSVTESGTPCKQEVYVDNFFVNETSESLFEESIKGINYGTRYLDDDFSSNPLFAINTPGQGSTGCSVEQLRDSDEIVKVTIAKAATGLPSFGSKAVSPAYGKDGHIPYKNEEYVFEMDVNFEDFNSDTKLLSFLKYNLDANSSDLTTNSCMIIENGGVFKVGTSADSMKYIAKLEKNKWYNFKFHYKPYNVVGGKNNGLMVDVYFMNELVGENLIVSKTTNKHIGTIRNVNVQPGLAPADGERVIKFDNLKFYQVNGVEFLPQVVDIEVSNASGDLISSTYAEGNNKITAYVTAKSAQEAGSLTLVVARYKDGQLIDVKPAVAEAITIDTLTKVTANLNVTDVQAGEFIKIMVVDSVDALNPYTKPIILSSSVQ